MKEHYKNPTPTVDVIIEEDAQILLVKRRKEPFKNHLALPGGFVNDGEKVEDAAKREVREETSLDVDLIDILGVYSDPVRDPRGHSMSTVFIGRGNHKSNKIKGIANDDAAALEWVNIETVEERSLGFDHKRIISDYKRWRKFGGTFWSSKHAI
jgi:ADP-ribose pyrophosphatase YjhB (NUDIX family)